MKKQASFVTTDENELVWREIIDHSAEEVECVYLCHRIGDPPHQLFKLTQSFESKNYYWAALWHTCCHAGHPKPKGNKTGQLRSVTEAIRAMLDNGYEVKRLTWDEFIVSPFED